MSGSHIHVCITFGYFLLLNISLSGHLGCFQFLSTMRKATMNILIYVFFPGHMHLFISLGSMPRSGITGLYKASISLALVTLLI